MNFLQSQTMQNLARSFAGESQARNKYTYFASVAKKQGFEQIAALFLKTAENEKEHAKLWFRRALHVCLSRRRRMKRFMRRNSGSF